MTQESPFQNINGDFGVSDIKRLPRVSLPRKGRTALRQAPRETRDPQRWGCQDSTGQIHSHPDHWHNWGRGSSGMGTAELGSYSDQRWRCLVLLMDLKKLVLLESEETQQEHKSLPQDNISRATMPAAVSSLLTCHPNSPFFWQAELQHTALNFAHRELGWKHRLGNALVHHPDPPPHQPPKEAGATPSH